MLHPVVGSPSDRPKSSLPLAPQCLQTQDYDGSALTGLLYEAANGWAFIEGNLGRTKK
jgi:hypothetical protein